MDDKKLEDIYLSGGNAEYDASAKKLLSSKKILAWILKYCVPEFESCEIADIRDKYIEGTPEVGVTPVLPDETNAARIVGDNVEDKTLTEGTVTFDIRFRAITPEKDSLGLIINIEAQHSSNLDYPLTKRAVFYCSRLISAQHDTVFTKSEYGKIKKVYSIWLCMDSPDETSGITRYSIEESFPYGHICEEKKNYDLAQIVMIYLSGKQKEIGNRLLSLLYEIFKSRDNAAGKMRTLEKEYDIALSHSEEGMVDTMCNLSIGIARESAYKGYHEGLDVGFERGEKIGMERGEKIGMERGEKIGVERGEIIGINGERKRMTIGMLKEGMAIPVIVSISGLNEVEVRKIAEEEKLPC